MSSIKKTDHFYLIDGSGYIFRAYYALPPLSRKSDGLPTGAVSGFCSMLFKLLEDARSDNSKNKPTHFAVIFDSARRFDLRMQPSLMLLQKTLVNIEGLGKQLYPALDFWSIANPFLKNWISERYNPKKLTEWAKRNSLSWFEKARKFPEIADTAIEQVSRLEEYQNANEERHNQLMQKIYIQGRNNGIILVVLIICLFLFIAT